MEEKQQKTFDPFEKLVCRRWPGGPSASHKAVLAVSGGADSTALLVSFARLLQGAETVTWTLRKMEEQLLADPESPARLPRPLTVVHINHSLRGDESDKDAEFVQKLAEQFQLPFKLVKLDSHKLKSLARRLGSLEAAARSMRYEELTRVAEEVGARYILTAHQREDQLETLLQRIFRGSSFSGLVGISPVRSINEAVVLVRPFLEFKRSEILEYLDRVGIHFRTDSSNASPEFTRNRIRHELMPLLEEIFPNKWSNALLRLSQRSVDVLPFVEEQVIQFEGELQVAGPIQSRPNEMVIPILRLLNGELNPPDYLLSDFFKRIWKNMSWPLRDMGSREWKALAEMVRSEEKELKKDFPGKISAQKSADVLILKRVVPEKKPSSHS